MKRYAETWQNRQISFAFIDSERSFSENFSRVKSQQLKPSNVNESHNFRFLRLSLRSSKGRRNPAEAYHRISQRYSCIIQADEVSWGSENAQMGFLHFER
jgi:hypothetical protein